MQSHYAILEDTLVGVLLEPFHLSLRKRQRKNPKFYFFDTGVKSALERSLDQPLAPGTYAYGKAFEHFVVKDDAEIDLVVERPGLRPAFVEIKSAERIGERDTRTLERFCRDFGRAEAFCLSRDSGVKKIGPVLALPWEKGLGELGL